MRVLYIGSYSSSTELFLQLLKQGIEHEWGTVETAEEAKNVEKFYDAVICCDGVEFHSKKLISKNQLNKGEIT